MIHNQNKNSPADAVSTTALLSVCRAVNIRQNENGDTLDRIRSAAAGYMSRPCLFQPVNKDRESISCLSPTGLICDVTPSGVTFCVITRS